MPTPTELLTPAGASAADPAIARAAEIIRAGGLVAFPTETVYGLAADSLNEDAVGRVFEAKGRPAGNPLIVHVVDAAAARELAAEWPEVAQSLAAAFWPGPLTLVVWKRSSVPAIVTAGGPTVAIRVPAHPMAQALLRAAGRPLAAPSANRSSRVSPTTATHVLRDLAGSIDLILDGGPTPGGIESTVVDVTVRPPQLLRPGPIGPSELERVAGRVTRVGTGRSDPGTAGRGQPAPAAIRSPGMLSRHYAPNTPLELVPRGDRSRLAALVAAGKRIGWLSLDPAALGEMGSSDADKITVVAMPTAAQEYAARLYAALHVLDAAGLDVILAEMPPDEEDWLAVRDRLLRASDG